MASASGSLKRYLGMGGRLGSPLTATPVMKYRIAAPFSQPGNPAMLGALSTQTGAGSTGLKVRGAPCSHCDWTGSPFSPRGVWQSPHRPTCSTRYLPRAIRAARAAFCGLFRFGPAKAGISSKVPARAATTIFHIERISRAQLGSGNCNEILALCSAASTLDAAFGVCLPAV